MGSRMQTEEEAMLLGQANMWHFTNSAVESMALRCAVELRIADIINSHGSPITLSQIAADIGSPTLDVSGLSRLLRYLVHKKVFDEFPHSDSETVYGLNHSSKWLLHHAELSMAPLILLSTHSVFLAPRQLLSRSMLEGGTAFHKGHGREIWQHMSVDPEFNKVFNEGMACTGRITTNAIMNNYEGGFDGIGTLVDVGGGIGAAIGQIVKANPHIKGINFDLPHVVATAPAYKGVTHVGGSMFEDIPKGDAMFIKWIMHNWNDEDCVKILKNCRKAIPLKTGKIILVDVVLEKGGDSPFDDTAHVFDLLMLPVFKGGGERSEGEWKKILDGAGFPRYKIKKIPALLSIIEAYPD